LIKTTNHQPTMKPNWKPTLGEFSKALPGSVALNFSESGGENCSTTCQALKLGVCYAVHVEKMKPSVQKSGERKREFGFAALCRAYRAQILRRVAKGEKIPWLRISTFGSVPNRPLTAEEVSAFVDLVRAVPAETPIHFPVESKAKAERFRALAHAHGLRYVVRESCQSTESALRSNDAGLPSSRIVYAGKTKKERLANAARLAKSLKNARVCPAIASTINRRPNPIKCGQCNFCARPDVATVLYPQH
jgi:hypothetical protein